MSCENQRLLWQQRDQELTQATADRELAKQALLEAEDAARKADEAVSQTATAAAGAYQAYLDCLTG